MTAEFADVCKFVEIVASIWIAAPAFGLIDISIREHKGKSRQRRRGPEVESE
jgi:hypothetical protein